MRCPVCRARLDANLRCRRCGCDLSLARACSQAATSKLHHALQQLWQGNPAQAGRLASEAVALDASEIVRQTAAFIFRCRDRDRPSHTASLQVDPDINRLKLP